MATTLRICAVWIVLCFALTQANNYSDPYGCYGDVCNYESPAQFCDIVLRHCRRCDEIQTDCFTRQQTFNCTEFCYETRYKQAVKELRVAGCQVPPPPEHGQFKDTRNHVPFNDTLTVICGSGYTPLYDDPIICGEFSTWSGPLPICESSTNYYLILAIILGVCFLLSLVVNVVILIRTGCCRWLRKNSEKKTSTKETQRLLDSKDNEQELDNLKRKSADKQSDLKLDEIVISDENHDGSGICSPASNTGGAIKSFVPTLETQKTNSDEMASTRTNNKGSNSSPKSSRDANIQDLRGSGGTSVGSIIHNHINTTVNVFPQNGTCPATEESQQQNPESTPELLKRPVEETNYTASETVIPIEPDDNGNGEG
ncbi:uncharacterized protein LOC127863226 isoform X2 [Dreissena polymorpha]|uniref:uncharacterized protein LOC127863226 isoform X2 n=1 Tax=Dreissena polymorpha TaxID=45954 RepID=UPI0022650473|nr:uncharacterized protein LOC127863226 isoform X2 [Dreissena polymorpha]